MKSAKTTSTTRCSMFTAASATAIAIFLSAAPASAQDAAAPVAAESQVGLSEIVVTAQRRAENMQDVPISVTAVTSEALGTAGSYNVLDLEKVAPGLQVYQTGTAVLPFIRGIGSNQSTNGFESPVAIYVDGIYQANKSGNNFDLANIERIEVLKGPQGTLFGRNATGGAISIVTKDPGSETEINVEGGYGRFNEKRTKAYAAGPITDTLSASVAFTGRWDDGYLYNPDLDIDANPTRNMVGMAKLVWRPSEDFTARLSGSYFKHDDATFLSPHVVPGTIPTVVGLGLVANYDKNISRNDHVARGETSGYRGTLNLDYDMGAVRLVSLTGYIHGESYSVSNSDISQSTLGYSGSGQPADQFSQELQIQSNNSGPFKWIGGLYYMYFKEGFGKPGKNFHAPSNVPSPIRPADLLAPGASVTAFSATVDTNAYAAFAEGKYEVTDALGITAGLRYSKEKKGVQGTLYRYAALPAAGNVNTPLYNTVLGPEPLVFGITPLNSIDKSDSFAKVTWRLAVDYKVNDDVMVYASYNRGFKSGTFNPSSITPTQVAVRPELIDAYEIGLKSELFDRRVRFNASAFYYDYSNIQVGLISSLGVTTVQNAAAATVKGLDLELTVQATEGLQIRSAVNLLDSKYKSYGNAQIFLPRTATACSAAAPLTPAQAAALAAQPKIPGSMSCALDASGLDLIFAPKFTANFAADYSIPIGESRILLNGSFYYNGGYDITPGGYFAHVNSYESLSLSATYFAPEDRYFVRLWTDNLTNDRHPIYISPQALGFQEVAAKPTTYGVTVGFKLGDK
jgi:iron complex outermembrane receptor protein